MSVQFGRVAESPELSADAVGVAIAARWEAVRGELRKLVLHGTCRVLADQAEAIGARPLQQALVVTITAGFRFESVNLVGEQLTFPDDEMRGAGFVQGYFNADLLARFGLGPGERCFVLTSLGPHLSNVLEVVPADGEGAAGY